MRLSADHESSDYHQVVNFIDLITVNGARINHAISVDTSNNTATVMTQPLREDPANPGYVLTHIVDGKIDILWHATPRSVNGILGSGTEELFLTLKADWEKRERLRELAKESGREQ